MKKLMAVVLVAVLAAPALPAAVEGKQVLYVGGTAPVLEAGAIGTLDTSRADALVFESSGKRVEIPYQQVRSFEYKEKRARRLGILLTVGVAMVKRLQRRHFVEIAYRGIDETPQVVVLEVSKEMAMPVVAILEARAPRPCQRGMASTLSGPAPPCRVAHTSYIH